MTTGAPPRLVAALAAVFAPARAGALLALAPEPAVAEEASRIAPLSRTERLDALAAALAALPDPAPRARELAAAAERPRVAAMLRGAGAWTGRSVLSRLVEERIQACAPRAGGR